MECINSMTHPVRASWSILVQHPNFVFLFLLLFRYVRFVGHLVGYLLYRPSPVLAAPFFIERDCTVVIPTCAPEHPAFRNCIESVVRTQPKAIRIVTVGREQARLAQSVVAPFASGFPKVYFKVSHTTEANKRLQVAAALPSIRTRITVLCDDHVIWPSSSFLRAAIAPFEHDPEVGGVGTKKRVVRHKGIGLWQGFWNVMGALYLERHNFEHTASNTIDGGVAVISGRTSLYRTKILQNEKAMEGYLNEMFFFGLFGPVAADDDNFLTRLLVKEGWKVKFQNTEDAMILCDVGEYPKFLSQCLRWARTTFRSNMCSLITDRSIYKVHPWTVYALMVGQMINFALFWDALLLWTLTRTDFYTSELLKRLSLWIILSKVPKLVPYFWTQPFDLIYLPTYYIFAYFHSFLKLWALLTFWDVQWSGRNLQDVNDAVAHEHEEEHIDASPPPAYNDIHGPVVRFDEEPLNTSARRLSRSPLTSNSTAPRPVRTPWGFVKPVNLQNSPVNVLQYQLAGRSWPAGWSTRKKNLHRDQGYVGAHSPRALDFENHLAVGQQQTGYRTPTSSMSSGSDYDYCYHTQTKKSKAVSRRSGEVGYTTPPGTPWLFQPLSTPSRTRSCPDRSYTRVDWCGRLHESYYPLRRCVL